MTIHPHPQNSSQAQNPKTQTPKPQPQLNNPNLQKRIRLVQIGSLSDLPTEFEIILSAESDTGTYATHW